MRIRGRHVLVAGLGTTGRALVRFLCRRGARVTVTDSAPAAELREALAELRDCAPAMELGGHREESFQSADLVVLSPGVPGDRGPAARAAASGIPVIGEIELAYRFMKTPILAVTGTNGKSTATLLAGEMLKAAGFRVFVGGNLGTPLISYADEDDAADFAVAEVSSFQLDTIDQFAPRIAVCLNITPDHLDRYADFSAYVRSKARIFENQTQKETAVVNRADPAIRQLLPEIAAQVLPFPAGDESAVGARLEGFAIHFRLPEKEPFQVSCSRSSLIGAHNRENIAAAGLAAAAAGASPESIQQTVDRFRALPHRMEPVAVIDGVHYIDDSKATNVDAVSRALAAFETPVILIMGGRGKGGGYSALKRLFPGRVKHLVVLGEAAGEIEAELGGLCGTSRAESMSEAIGAAGRHAEAGDTVLLSPACASFDMYASYAARGDDFAACVKSAAKASGKGAADNG